MEWVEIGGCTVNEEGAIELVRENLNLGELKICMKLKLRVQ